MSIFFLTLCFSYMKSKSYIRSSSHSLRFANAGKRVLLFLFLYEFRNLLQIIVDDLWENGIKFNTKDKTFHLNISNNILDCPSLLPTEYLKRFESPLSARMVQCVGKQACSMIKSAIKKRSKQLFMLDKLMLEDKDTKYLEKKIDSQPLVKPKARNANAELDSRFIDFKESSKLFDLFIKINQLGNKENTNIPLKHNRVSRKWLSRGRLKPSLRLTPNSMILIYDIPKLKKSEGKIIGCDQGSKTVVSLSDQQVTKKCPHGHDLDSIQDTLKRKVKGSKGFKKAQDHRENYINWSLNQLNYSEIKELRYERVKNIRLGKKCSRKLSHWTYTLIRKKIIRISEEEGFQFIEVTNEFRSQRCSCCGWVRKSNRKGKTFKCTHCGFVADSDLNAAANLELDLFEIPIDFRSKKMNLVGFFWTSLGLFSESWEPIVPDAKSGE